MATIEEQVLAGSQAFARYEGALVDLKNFNMRGLLKQLYDDRKIGYLEYQHRAAEFEALCSNHEAETFAMHRSLTSRAQELAIDLPQPESGGSR